MRDHIKILAYLYLAGGFLGLLVAGVLLLGLGVGGALSGVREVALTLGTIGIVISIIIAILSAPSIVLGWALLNGKPWSRVLGIVLSILHLPNFPLGTALGAYGIWIFTNPEAERLLSSGAMARRVGSGAPGGWG